MVKGNSQKLPSLDGWRMVSIPLVLLAQCGYAAGCPEELGQIIVEFNIGNPGVRFFFPLPPGSPM